MPGLLLLVQPSGRRTWFYRPNNRTKQKLGDYPAVTLEMARKTAASWAGKVAEEGLMPKRNATTTFGDFRTNRYDPWVKANHKDAKGTLGALDYNFGFLNGRQLANISAGDIDRWRAEALKAGMKQSSVNRRLISLKAALSKAVEWGMLREHPLRSVKAYRVDGGRVRYLNAKERARLMAVLKLYRKPKSRQRHIVLPVHVLLNTGLRLGELNSVRKADVDLQTGLLTVRGEGSKSARTRHVPMNSNLLRMVKADWAKLDDLPFYVGRPKHAWATLMEDAKLSNFTIHCCRHDFASQLVMGGVDLRTVQELLGHASPVMTMRYAHLAPEHKKSAVEVVPK